LFLEAGFQILEVHLTNAIWKSYWRAQFQHTPETVEFPLNFSAGKMAGAAALRIGLKPAWMFG
jgi:hypothetical protein